MRIKRLLTSLIIGLALSLVLLTALNVATFVATLSTMTDAIALEPDAPIDAPSSNSREKGFDDLPPGLAPALARAMADDLPDSYHVQANRSGYQAENAAHGLATTFGVAGPLIEIASETWGLSLTGMGREGAIEPVPAITPVANGSRLEYRYPDLTEWYLNTNWGLEQGFTIPYPPGDGDGELVLELTTRGSLKATLARVKHSRTDGDTTLLLTDAEGQTVARYTGLHAYDANGRDLPARLTIRNSQLAIRVDDASAVYPITVDPWVQSAKLTADDGAAGDCLGSSVAIDGDTVVVGAPSGGMFPTPGAVYVFRKSGTSWSRITQVSKLTASDGMPGDGLGSSVAIEGETVVAGARYAEIGQGAVYVFVEPWRGWPEHPVHTAKLTADDGAQWDYLGSSVDIYSETIVAGADGDDDYLGAAYVFVKPEDGWCDITHTAKLTAADGAADDWLGSSVAIEGDTVVVGAYGDDDYQGAAYVFLKPAGGWRDITHTARLMTADGAAYDYLGRSVDIYSDTVVVGAYGDDVGSNNNQGAAYVFVKPTGGWRDITHTARLTAADGAEWDNLGRSTTIDGDTIVIGAYGNDVGGDSDAGAAYIFSKPTEGWRDITHTAKLTAADGAQWDNFGWSIAVDGDAVVVGAYGDDVGGDSDAGAAYVFAQPLALNKSVMPIIDAPYHGAVTYTVVLSNTGPVSETNVLMADTLSAQSVIFARWVVSPTGTLRTDDGAAGSVITWNGAIPADHTLTWMWVVTHTGDYGDNVTNTAEFTGVMQTGADDAIFTVEEPPVLYVDTDAAGDTHDGFSWTTAYTNVQDALNRANTHGVYDYEIWVAEGIYYPDEGAGHTDDSENESFTLSHNNVQLYGGFAGGESARDQRDWEANLTILSGDIDANDTDIDGNGIAEAWDVITGSNANHLLWLDGVTNEPITETTVIDGFTITAGQADGSDLHNDGGGLYCDGYGSDHECSPTLTNITFSGNRADDRGGGMHNDGRAGGASNPVLTNVAFNSNRAEWYGGGMCDDGRNDGVSSPTLARVIFNSNQAGYYGGGMYNDGCDNGASNPTLANVALRGNQAGHRGGGMYNDGFSSGDSSPALTNVIFSGNKAYSGGGMFNGGSGDSSPALTNVTLSGNKAPWGGGGMYNDYSNPELVNVIIWGNESGSNIDGNQLYNVSADLILNYTLISDGAYDVYNDDDSTVTYGDRILNSDPQFVAPVTAYAAPTSMGNYRLKCTSSAIDAGDNTAPGLGSVATDLDESVRFIDMPRADTGHGDVPIVDMGAYEASPTLELHKTVAPTQEVAYRSAVTYTILLSNTGAVSDTNLLFTDTLSAQPVTFARWVVSPTGTLRAGVAGSVITWNGALTAGHTLTWTWVVTYTGFSGDSVTNTAEFSGALQAGTDAAAFAVDEPDVLYIDADASGSVHDGFSWARAYANLQDALDRANAHGAHDYEIWVAEGVYYPDEGAGHTDDDESESFTLSHNNVQLYGGFAGGEDARDQRDCEANVTILSGDIDGDDIDADGNGIAETADDLRGDNTDHLLWLDGVTNEPITKTTVIDGFIITAGQADGSDPHDDGGGLYCDGAGGGHECNPILTNVTFSGNQADGRGGGMYNEGHGGGVSNPTLTNVAFSGNLAYGRGGGMYNDGEGGASNPTLTNVAFTGNRAVNDDGGGIYNDGHNDGISSPALTNVTLSANQACLKDGGGMYSNGSNGGLSSPALVNVIIWGNEAGEDGEQLYNEYATPVLSYTLIQTGTVHIFNDGGSSASYFHVITGDPQFVAPITATAAPTTAGNYRLQTDSPAIDAGDNAAPGLDGITADLDGNARFTNMLRADTGNGAAPIVDMGAYEALPPLRLRKTVTAANATQAMQSVAHGGVVTYTVFLANAGAYSDTVLLTDTIPTSTNFATWVVSPTGTVLAPANGEITWSGVLTAGHALTWTWGVTHTGDYGDVVINTAEFSSTLQTGEAEAAFTVEPEPPNLALSKTVTPTTDAPLHSAVTYTIVLSNTGAMSDTNVIFTDTLSAQPVTFARWVVSPTGTLRAGDGAAGSVITWNGTLTAGHALTWTWAVTHTGDYGDRVTNTAAFSGTCQIGEADATFTVEPKLPHLTLSKTVTPTTDAPLHSAVTYTVVLSNTGAMSDTNVIFTDTLSAQPVTFAGWVVSPTGTLRAGDGAAGSIITWNGTLTAGHALTWTWAVTHTGSYSDIVTNTAVFSGTLQAGEAEAIFTVAPSLVDVEIAKSAAPTSAAPGDPIMYTLTFSNTGRGTATGVVITDDIPISVTQTSVLSTSDVALTLRGGARYVWDVGDLAPGVGGVITISGVLSDSLAASSTFINTAVIAAAADKDSSNNSSSASMAVRGVTSSAIYLPVVMKKYVGAPDLVVKELVAAPNQVQVVIENVRDTPVEDEFWVDVYINPATPPTRVNQMWQNVGDQGLVWGVTQDALPMLPGDALTLTVGDAFYWPSESNVNWPLVEDAPVYAQVDSAGDPAYGGVLEGHEIMEWDYNNIAETTVGADTTAHRLNERGWRLLQATGLPRRRQ